MDNKVSDALKEGGIIDITTTGRKSGAPRKIEISFRNVGGEVYISSAPGKRDWYANMLQTPEFIFHLKGNVQANLRAKALPVIEESARNKYVTAWSGHNGSQAGMRVGAIVMVKFEDNHE